VTIRELFLPSHYTGTFRLGSKTRYFLWSSMDWHRASEMCVPSYHRWVDRDQWQTYVLCQSECGRN